MVSEHIYRDFSNHTKHTYRPEEYCKVEIFAYEHKYTQTYHYNNYTFKGSNFQKVNHRHLTCLEAKKNSQFSVDMSYNCLESGEYRIDVLYENKNSKDYVGSYELGFVGEYNNSTANIDVKTIQDTSILNPKVVRDGLIDTTDAGGNDLNFDGEKNIIKREVIFEEMSKGTYTFTLNIPENCYFIGVIIRKIKKYMGDNLQSVGTTLQFKEADVTFSDMCEPVEANFTIGYSQTYDNMLSRTGLYFDYMNEVNLYFRVNGQEDGAVHRRFGGYISSVKLNEDRTTIEFSCGDRLLDGDTKYVLDSLLILDGTASPSDIEYYNPISFKNYGQAIKYIADIFEITLDTNIKKNYLVEGEKYNTGLSLKFGKKRDIKKVTVSNAEATVNDKSITLRNKPSGKKKQSIVLYQPKTPKLLRKWSDKDNRKNNYLTFHMVYGLGATKQTGKSTVSETSSDSSNSAGSQSWTKCGVSQDKKYVMGIGKVSGSASFAKKKGFNTKDIYKSIFKNKCPHCKKEGVLRWDRGTKGTNCITCGGYSGSKRTWGNISETEISCNNCCADYDAVTGREKDKPYKQLTVVKKGVLSSKSEQDKLASGKMQAVAKGGEKISADAFLKSIVKLAKQYTYEQGSTGQTYAQMKKTGHGDCWGFSDLIFREFKRYNVSCRVYEYNSGSSPKHRVVMYKNAKNQWVKFPYKKYNLYPNKLGFTANFDKAKKTKRQEHKGTNIANVKSKASSSSTSSTTVTTTTGFDKDKPIQGYIELTYSYTKSTTAKTKTINLDFTQKAGTNNDLTGLTTVWVNNTSRKTSVDMSRWFDDNEPNKDIYLHRIRFVAPKIKTTNQEDNTDWYTFDKSTHDYSSCKMNLYQIIFDDGMALNPTDLQSCGKSLSDMLKELVEASGYHMERVYAEHRCDDKLNLSIENTNDVVFKASEGDNNNILEWSSINYNPVSDLRNKSICVFKQSDGKYAYVDTGEINSMLNYGEKTTLQTISDQIGSKEAYFNARNSEEYNPEEIYSYTIVVPYAPLMNIQDQIQVISNNKQLNDIKTIKSLKISYSNSQKPMIRTEIGCDEIEPFLRLRKQQEKLRKDARSEKTWFGRTASPITDEEIYIWDN